MSGGSPDSRISTIPSETDDSPPPSPVIGRVPNNWGKTCDPITGKEGDSDSSVQSSGDSEKWRFYCSDPDEMYDDPAYPPSGVIFSSSGNRFLYFHNLQKIISPENIEK
jgi:hypothetical protein